VPNHPVISRRDALRIATFGSLAIAAAACGSSQAAGPGAAAPVGAGSAPDFTVELIDGETFRLSDHLGKEVVVIDFWATFCVPCLAVLKHLQELHDKYKDKGLVVLGVSLDPPETAGQIQPFVRSRNLTYAIAHDVNSQIANLYNKKGSAPYQVLIGRAGHVIKRRETYQPGDEVGMEQEIAAALG